MPIKTDGTGKRWVEMDFLVPGTPEQVWQAMATGAGNAAWFTNATIEERVGGTLRFEFGPDMYSSGEVTIWEPPHRFGYVEREWDGDAPPIATEIVITRRSEDECAVRMVHMLFSPSNAWDGQMEGFEKGWPSCFETLRIYLRHFAGKKAASFNAVTKVDGDPARIWSRLTQELGLADANAGERRTTPSRPESLSGVVERAQEDAAQRSMTLRLDTPAPGLALLGVCEAGSGVMANMSMFFYGDDAAERAAATQDLWRAWFSETFPSAS
jgi:uncharacterized protein YndB with AHSA1/START domain